jgi:hypothetical protein
MTAQYDESYVLEILAHVQKLTQQPKDRAALIALCAPDLRAGYTAEVEEAARRLFPTSKRKEVAK